MILDHVAAQLRFPAGEQALCTDWDAAMQTGPANGLPFLQADFVAQAARDVFLTDDMIRTLVAFAPRVAHDEAMLAFFWYCRHRILTDATLTDSWEAPWPLLDDYLGADAGLLNVLVMLATVPEMLAVYRRLGIPADLHGTRPTRFACSIGASRGIQSASCRHAGKRMYSIQTLIGSWSASASTMSGSNSTANTQQSRTSRWRSMSEPWANCWRPPDLFSRGSS